MCIALLHQHLLLLTAVAGLLQMRMGRAKQQLAQEDLQRLPRRGLSLDPDGQGQGIGLAMVADIVDAAQGELRLANARPGFLAELRFDALP